MIRYCAFKISLYICRVKHLNTFTMNYKVHLFASLRNNKLHLSIMQCGRYIYRNSTATHVVKFSEFVKYYLEDQSIVCSKCLEWAKANGKIN